MTGKAEVAITLAKDCNSVTLQFVLDGKPEAHVIIDDASELDRLIALLGAVREMMTDQIPLMLDPQPRIPIVKHPNWWVFDPRPEGRTLALRHPGFGWIGFLLPPDRAEQIAEWLKKDRPSPWSPSS